MWAYGVVFTGLFIVASGFAATGLHPLAMVLFPIPVALYEALGMRGRSRVLVACAMTAALWTTLAVPVMALYGLAAGLGLFIGSACRRHWSFGRCVTAVTLASFPLMAAGIVANWKETRHEFTIWISARIADLQAASKANGENELQSVYIEMCRWLDLNWPYVVLGVVFGCMLLGALVTVAVVTGRLRRLGADTLSGFFREMRTPEWLVWLVILVALLWFWDRRWPNDALRMVTWNSAIGLAVVYLVNGFSILVYAVYAFKLNPFLFYAIIFGLFYFGLQPMLCAIGFFDTWWDFRMRFARAAQARLNRPPEDNET